MLNNQIKINRSQTQKYLAQVLEKCSRIPWPLHINQVQTISLLSSKTAFIWQEFVTCGPESNTCVANQTLKDKGCLLPCEGLYADITVDTDTFNQNMMKKIILSFQFRTKNFVVLKKRENIESSMMKSIWVSINQNCHSLVRSSIKEICKGGSKADDAKTKCNICQTANLIVL